MIESDLNELTTKFNDQFPYTNIGGFYNPTLECIHSNSGDLEFRCYYDNYDNKEDSWTWYYSIKTNKFYN